MPKIFRQRSFLFVLALVLTLTPLPLAAQNQHHMAPAPEVSKAGARKIQPAKPNLPQDPIVQGQWNASVMLGIPAIHAVLLHTGKVLTFWYPLGANTNSPSKLYDSKTGGITDVTIPFPGDFFCGGQTIMADGRVLVTGGLNGNPFPGVGDYGITLTAIFDPDTETWTQGPNMNLARWYPTNMEMANGKILTLSGKNETGMQMQLQLEVYDPAANTWTILPPSANLLRGVDSYPKVKVLPSGRIFMAGANAQTRLFNPVTNRWAPFGVMNFGNRYHGAAVLLGGTPDKPLTTVLTAGGTLNYPGGGATATAETIDVTAPTPTWTYTNPMSIPRYNANLVILADGNALMIGGAQTKKYTDPVMIPELYDVATATWTEMATQPSPRAYHSTALLLPDGTVFSAGSDDPLNTGTDVKYEIYSPPYLFKGARPVISSTAASITYNQPFVINTADAASIKSVALVRPGAVTHDNDMDQRYVPLKFQKGNGKLKAFSPLNANYAPPGWYMVVIVDTNGVPSVMPFLKLQ